MKKNTIFAAALTAFAALAFSCGKKEALYQYDMTAEAPAARTMMHGVKKAAPAALAAGAEAQYSPAEPDGNAAAPEAFERKLIKRGSIDLEVTAIAETGTAIERWCKEFGGYVESSYSGESDGNITVRIPSVRFDEAMRAAGNMGTVKSKNVSTEDVSERFYDLQTRLEARKVMRSRLQTYLSQAKDTKDMLHIESELNRVITDIESMEGSMKRLSSQIDYSTIDVQYRLPYRAKNSGGFEWPDVSEGFRYFISNTVDFFAGLLKALLYAVVCGLPVLGIAAALYWLLFGKIGLVKKVLRTLSGKNDEK